MLDVNCGYQTWINGQDVNKVNCVQVKITDAFLVRWSEEEKRKQRLNKQEKVKQTCCEMPLTFSFTKTAGEREAEG